MRYSVLRGKNGCTDKDAVWDVELGGFMEPRIGWDAHWRNLANTTELSMCGGNVALYQITLATYYYYYKPLFAL